ncbi:MAG: hypothetical protein K2J67_09415 [Lachnospiraceae bacterium]|nr:hypothetical protein [Lachnospiraceae bacterium]
MATATRVKKTVDKTNKKAVSIILNDPKSSRTWIDIAERKPEPGIPVVIRIMNESITFAEDDENIIYAEDMKVARRLVDINKGKESWYIEPPYTKYDYSPLSNRDKLSKGSVVTHWAEASDEEIGWWKSRLRPIGDYNHLSLNISNEYEELMYLAIINGASFIARSVDGDINEEGHERETAMYGVLTDLQFCIDSDSHIHHGCVVPNCTPVKEDMPVAEEHIREMMSKYDDDIHTVARIVHAMSIIVDNILAEGTEEEEADE